MYHPEPVKLNYSKIALYLFFYGLNVICGLNLTFFIFSLHSPTDHKR